MATPLLAPHGSQRQRLPGAGSTCCDRLFFRMHAVDRRSHIKQAHLKLLNAGSTRVRHEGGGEIAQCLALSFGFFFTFCAWHSAQNLQSSLPLHSGVKGTTALAIVYCLLGPGNFTAPRLVSHAGLKPSIVIAMGMCESRWHISCLYRDHLICAQASEFSLVSYTWQMAVSSRQIFSHVGIRSILRRWRSA